jgi:hypothetical protein
MSEDGEGFGFTVFLLDAPFELHSFGVPSEEEDGGFGEGPLEVGIADFLSRRAVTFAGGFFGALDEPGVGGEVLNPGESLDVLNLVENDEGEDGTDAVDGSQEIKGVGVVPPGDAEDVAFEVPYHTVEVIDEIEIGLDASSNARVGELLSDALAMDLVGNLSAELGKVALAVRVLDVGEEFGAFTCEVIPTSEEIAGGAHLPGVDVGLREHAATKKSGDLAGINSIVLGFTSVDGFHIEGMSEDKWDVLLLAEVGEPVPSEHALGGDHDTVPVGSDGVKKGFRLRLDVPVELKIPGSIEDAQIH